jgi:ankyrin repeat protein
MTTIRTVMLFSVVLAVLGSCAGTPQGTTTPLHTAAEEGDIDEVMELIAGKSKVNARDEMGRTALHRAAIAGDIFVTAALLNVGADPNLVDVDGRSVLHFAVLTCDTDLVAMLLGAPTRIPMSGTRTIGLPWIWRWKETALKWWIRSDRQRVSRTRTSDIIVGFVAPFFSKRT